MRGFEASFPHAGILGGIVCLTPQLFLPVCPQTNVVLPGPPAATLPDPQAAALPAPVLQLPPCRESYLLLLPVWINVSSLTAWLSDFHTVQSSRSSGCFLFLNLLSYFCLCEEAQCIYLHLHLGWKSWLLFEMVFLKFFLLWYFTSL